uniref:Uncharacterized protein n=1 Tax=uncultured bacterium contig00111 TaxID=1181575 RepID=A0A806KST1_9BACT|nr:hypothetical protein [uncultured bacterium contig00111]
MAAALRRVMKLLPKWETLRCLPQMQNSWLLCGQKLPAIKKA